MFNLSVSLLSLWMIAGLYMDGSAHHHIPELIETFFTPWHAVLYSGFLASAGLLVVTQWRNVSKGYRWTQALPQGYGLSLVGMVIFTLAGGGDFLWHTAFGFEVGIEALVSPTHLALAMGGGLMIAAPVRAALQGSHSQALEGWRALLPVVLSLLGIFSILTFFMGEFSAITYPNLVVNRPLENSTYFYDMHLLGSVLIPSALLMGSLLFALRHWRLPLGSLTIIIVGNAALMTWFHLREVYLYPQVLPGVIFTGLTADVLYRVLRPSAERIWAWRWFAFSVPALLFGVFFVILITTAGIWWSVHLWTGAVFLAGIVGLLMSYLIVPPVNRGL